MHMRQAQAHTHKLTHVRTYTHAHTHVHTYRHTHAHTHIHTVFNTLLNHLRDNGHFFVSNKLLGIGWYQTECGLYVSYYNLQQRVCEGKHIRLYKLIEHCGSEYVKRFSHCCSYVVFMHEITRKATKFTFNRETGSDVYVQPIQWLFITSFSFHKYTLVLVF